jgi:hypothetical protein
MFFAWDITIPANTLRSEPYEQMLHLQRGIITRIDVKYPRGCHGNVGVRLFCHESLILPFSRGEWLTGDDEAVRADMYFPLEPIPYELKFHGHSEGCTYDHTVTVRITILPKTVASFIPVIELITKLLERMGVL